MRDPRRTEFAEYAPLVQKQIVIINEVLDDVGVAGLFKNDDFTIDFDMSAINYLKFNLCRRGSNSVELDFHLASDGMSIDFQGLPESFEFSTSIIENTPSDVKKFVASLVSGPILVEYKGGAQYVNMFNRDGSRFGISALQSFVTIITRGYWKWQSTDQHLFEAIYPVNG